MKTSLKTALFGLCIVLVACTNKQTAKQILKDSDMRKEIIADIANDTAMAAEMINRLSSTEATHRILPLTCTMLKQIEASDSMSKDTTLQNLLISGTMRLMANDSAVCDKTCTWMSQNPAIMKTWQNKLPERTKVGPK